MKLIMMILLLIMCKDLDASPWYPTWRIHQEIKNTPCPTTPDIVTTCQFCSKITKAEGVYTMCCNNQDGAQSWCKAAVEYGRT